MISTKIHLCSLTGLRFYAAMAVVLFHLSMYIGPFKPAFNVFAYGFAGVSFFFILSGFVLTWSHSTGDKARTFYWHRVARVWPLHVVTTFLIVLVPPMSAESSTIWEALPFVLTLTQAWVPAGGYIVAFNGVSWSLSCEAFFYLMFPLVIGRLAGTPRPGMLLVFQFSALVLIGIYISVSIPGDASTYILSALPPYRFAEFILGVCLALLLKSGWRPKFTLRSAVVLALTTYAALIGISFAASGRPGAIPDIYANLALMPGFLAIIAAASSDDLTGRSGSLSSSFLVRLGRWSFALYLVHELVIRAAKPFMDGLDGALPFLATLLIGIVCVVASGVFHELIERPAEKWLRALAPHPKMAAEGTTPN